MTTAGDGPSHDRLDERTMERLLDDARKQAGLPHPSEREHGGRRREREWDGDREDRGRDGRGRKRRSSIIGRCPSWVVVIVLICALVRVVYLASHLTPSSIRERVEKERAKSASERPIQGPRGTMYPVKKPAPPPPGTADDAAAAADPTPTPTPAAAAEGLHGDGTPLITPSPTRSLGPAWTDDALAASDEATASTPTPPLSDEPAGASAKSKAKTVKEAKAKAKAEAKAKAKADREVKAKATAEAKAKSKADKQARAKADKRISGEGAEKCMKLGPLKVCRA